MKLKQIIHFVSDSIYHNSYSRLKELVLKLRHWNGIRCMLGSGKHQRLIKIASLSLFPPFTDTSWRVSLYCDISVTGNKWEMWA